MSGNGGSIIGCSATSNTEGIYVADGCLIRDNTLISNGAAATPGSGIRLYGTSNRVESNHIASNGVGITADGAGNYIARNTFSRNTANTNLAAGNSCAAMVSSAGPSFDVSNSWANFVH